MGFISGVITGIAVAAGAAAWYMSRSGERFRQEYKVEARLGEIGDQFEARTKEVQAQMNAQIAELRTKGKDLEDAATDATNGAGDHLDAAAASAAETAAGVAAEAEAVTTKVKKAAKDTTEG